LSLNGKQNLQSGRATILVHRLIRVTRQPTFAIRKATRGDVAGILACLAGAFEPYREQYTPEAFEDTVLTRATLDQRMQSMTVLVAENPRETVVGTVACGLASPAEGHLRGMAVSPGWQGAGVAQQLLARAESELQARGCSRITLDTTVPLERAMRFYEKNGYRRSGKVADFFGMLLIEYVKQVVPAKRNS
jgi:GNAT superfamily N-acetyltransferase